jgi:Asp-tRNA(Asn)/Glu-tRNA(Gln) amidotransferase A subunit family amidase
MEINGRRLTEVTITDIHNALFTGALSVRELVTAHRERIEAFDQAGPALNAMVSLNDDALREADELDAALRSASPRGALFGVPVLVKDNLVTAGMPTSFGSDVFRDYRAEEDAATVARLVAAGAVVLGKTTLPDWASAWFAYSSRSGWTKNPHALERSAGGSSCGTAAGVAAGYAPVGLGTDTGSSIRLPSSFCNLVGVRPTPGLISRSGCSPIVGMQDTVGPLGRTVSDVCRVFDVLVGYDPADPLSHRGSLARRRRSSLDALRLDALRGARLGVLRSAFGAESAHTRGVNQVMGRAISQCAAGGATVVDVEVPRLDELIEATFVYRFSARHELNQWLAQQPGVPMSRIEDIVAVSGHDRRIPLLSHIADGPDDPESMVEFRHALAARESLLSRLVQVLEEQELDALVFPTAQAAPPLLADVLSPDWNTVDGYLSPSVIASAAGMPAMSIPAGFTADGLPVGMEILARPFDEATLFRLGYGFEQLGSQHRSPVSTPQL